MEEKSERPVNIKIATKNDIIAIERLSIAKFDVLEFSSCGQYLAIKHQLYPTTLCIWNIIEDYLDYLLLENSIVGELSGYRIYRLEMAHVVFETSTAVKWNPARAHLLIFCACPRMFEWTPRNATCIPTPRSMVVVDARWHPRGNRLLLCGYNKAIMYELENKS